MFHVSKYELECFFQGIISSKAIRSFGMCEVGLILRCKPLRAMNLLPPVCNASGLSPGHGSSFYTKEIKSMILCVTENKNHTYVCLLK